MKSVLAHIMRKKRGYAALPLFDRLRDESLPAPAKLGFMPGLAFFIMAFGDLNRYVLRQSPATDAHQERVNEHTREDDHHWPWFLEDLEKLGWNKLTTTCNALRTLWAEDTHRSRVLMYDLCGILAGCDSVERLAVIEAIEETGNVLFALTTKISDAIQAQTGIELRYMGAFHFALESGHMQNGEHAELARIALSDEARDRCLTLVDHTFDAFAAWTHEATALIDRATAMPESAWPGTLSGQAVRAEVAL